MGAVGSARRLVRWLPGELRAGARRELGRRLPWRMAATTGAVRHPRGFVDDQHDRGASHLQRARQPPWVAGVRHLRTRGAREPHRFATRPRDLAEARLTAAWSVRVDRHWESWACSG